MQEREALVLGLKDAAAQVPTSKDAVGDHDGDAKMQVEVSRRADVAPATGESVWYLSNGIDKPFFAELLKAFARTTGAGRAQDRAAVRQCWLAWSAKSHLSGRHLRAATAGCSLAR
jgi:hypothetical protein